MFTRQKMAEFAAKAGFKLLTSTPYYAEANNQVEATNKFIIGMIKKYMGLKPINWHKTLGEALWAYRNSPKESTNATSFSLVYGHELVLPLEIHLQSVKIQRQVEISTEYYWG